MRTIKVIATVTGSSSCLSPPPKGSTARALSRARPRMKRTIPKTICTSTRTPKPPLLAKTRSAKPETRNTSKEKRLSEMRPPYGALLPSPGVENEPASRARSTCSRRRQGPHQVAAQQRHDRDHLHSHLHGRAVPRLHQTRALDGLRLRTERHLLELRQHREELSDPDCRRRRRQSDRHRA